MTPTEVHNNIRAALVAEYDALGAAVDGVGRDHVTAVGLLYHDQITLVTGVGKSGHVARKVAATMTSLGEPAVYLDPTAAAHGDLGLMRPGVVGAVLAFSKSGIAVDSRSGHPSEVGVVLSAAKQRGIPVVLVSENAYEGLASMADVTVPMPVCDEAWGKAPTSSTTIQIAIGDALAVALASLRGFAEDDFARNHPGGAIGIVADQERVA